MRPSRNVAYFWLRKPSQIRGIIEIGLAVICYKEAESLLEVGFREAEILGTLRSDRKFEALLKSDWR